MPLCAQTIGLGITHSDEDDDGNDLNRYTGFGEYRKIQWRAKWNREVVKKTH